MVEAMGLGAIGEDAHVRCGEVRSDAGFARVCDGGRRSSLRPGSMPSGPQLEVREPISPELVLRCASRRCARGTGYPAGPRDGGKRRLQIAFSRAARVVRRIPTVLGGTYTRRQLAASSVRESRSSGRAPRSRW
jgi:hypothetical protein